MTEKQIIDSILDELKKAKEKHPDMEKLDIVHQTAIMNEEAGESIKAAIQLYHEGGELKDLKLELIQTASTVFRILGNL